MVPRIPVTVRGNFTNQGAANRPGRGGDDLPGLPGPGPAGQGKARSKTCVFLCLYHRLTNDSVGKLQYY